MKIIKKDGGYAILEVDSKSKVETIKQRKAEYELNQKLIKKIEELERKIDEIMGDK